MHFIIPEDRNQQTLFGKLDDLISEDNPIRLLDALVEKIIGGNMDRFTQKGQHDLGRRAFHPAVFAKLYLYGYCNRITSSRRMETECYRNIELIWLLGGLKPDHKTIADYRKDNAEAIRFITLEFRLFLKEHGYIKGETISLDGTKIKANASKELLSLNKIEKMLEDVEGKLEAYLNKLNTNDLKDDLGDELEDRPEEESKEILINKIIHLQETIEKLTTYKETLKAQEENFIAPNDPDARLMKSRDGKIPAYNTQVAVDAEHKMIVLAEVTNDQADQNLLQTSKTQVEEQLNLTPSQIVADKGYFNLLQIQTVEATGQTTCYIPPEDNAKQNLDQLNEISFEYDPVNKEYTCSEGQKLVLTAQNVDKRKRKADLYLGTNCSGCPKRNLCTTSKKGRHLYHFYDEDWVKDYKSRMLQKKAKRMSKLRKTLSEHVFGTMKVLMGKIPLLMRGIPKVQTEIDIYSTAYNFKRLVNLNTIENLIGEVKEYK